MKERNIKLHVGKNRMVPPWIYQKDWKQHCKTNLNSNYSFKSEDCTGTKYPNWKLHWNTAIMHATIIFQCVSHQSLFIDHNSRNQLSPKAASWRILSTIPAVIVVAQELIMHGRKSILKRRSIKQKPRLQHWMMIYLLRMTMNVKSRNIRQISSKNIIISYFNHI